jgi:hypothetical protein
VRVFSRNLYLGSDLTPLALVGTPADIPAAVATLWGNAQATDFAGRAQVIAEEITALGPDLVALEEVALYRRQIPGDVESGNLSPNATEVVLDFLSILMHELDARGGGYQVAGVAWNGDAELPASDGQGGTFDLRLTDRDVILARSSVATSNFAVVPFAANLAFTVGGPGGVPVTFTRSTSHVDALVGDKRLVFGTSHLEVELFRDIQLAQGQALLDVYAQAPYPVLLLGDFNSAPGTAPYQLITSGFHDAYLDVAGGAPGYTCCQAGDLRNAESSASERIDLVLTRGAWQTNDVQVIGTDNTAGRAPSGVWASDHFGVSATVELLP